MLVGALLIYNDFVCLSLFLPLGFPQTPGIPGHAKFLQGDESENLGYTLGERWPTWPHGKECFSVSRWLSVLAAC